MTAATEIWTYRNLIYNLAQRELRARYKKSLLGWLWSLINPAAMLGIYTVVFGVFFNAQPPVAGNGHTKSYGMYLFAGLVVWNMFNSTVTGAIIALQTSGGLLNKVYFPPSAPAIANMMTVVLQALIEGGILAVIMIALGNVSITYILFPVTLVFLALFSMGIGLLRQRVQRLLPGRGLLGQHRHASPVLRHADHLSAQPASTNIPRSRTSSA